MPLKHGGKTKKSKQKAVSANISELTHHGTKPRSRKQIIAIAMSAAGLSKKKRKKK